MPSNQIDVNVSIDTPQADVAALAKLTEALKSIPGAKGGGGGAIQQTFGTAAAAGSYLGTQAQAAGDIGGKLSGASIKAMAEGKFEAKAKVDDKEGPGALAKAFNPGGMIAGMGTAVGAIGAGFKQLLGMSKIFQTFMGTTGKILGTAVDLMLAPLMPFFMRIMVWLIQKVFPLATKIGDFVGGFSDVGIGAALVGGYVALKIGANVLSSAGEKLGKWFQEKMPYSKIGDAISTGLSNAASTLKEWGGKVGGYIKDGLVAAKDAMVTLAKSLGTAVKDGFIAAKDKMIEMVTTFGTAIKDGFIAAKDKMVEMATTLGTAIKEGFIAAKDALVTFSKTLGTAIKEGFVAAKDALVTFSKTLGTAIQTGFIEAKDALVTFSKTLGTAIKEGFVAAKDKMVEMATTLGTAIKTGFVDAGEALVTFSKTLGTAIKTGFIDAKDALVTFSTTLGTAIKTGFMNAKDALVTFSKTLGDAIKTGFMDAKDALVTFAKTLGTAVQAGWKIAVDKASELWKGIGTLAQAGFKTAVEAAGTVWTAIGKVIGGGISLAGDAFRGAGKLIGDAIGGAMKVAKNLWSGIGSVGGMIGIGIGAAAIGATIGYMIWKKYDEYEKGKDVTTGLSATKTVEMLQERYGVGEDAAVMVQKRLSVGVQGEQIGLTEESVENFISKADEIAKGYRLFGEIDFGLLESMTRPQQTLYSEMLKAGMYQEGEQGIVKLTTAIDTQRKVMEGYGPPGSVAYTALKTGTEKLMGEGLVETKAERTVTRDEESRKYWYNFNLGPVPVRIPLDSLYGRGKGVRTTASKDERAVQLLWGKIRPDEAGYNNKYEEEMSDFMRQIAVWVLAGRGETPTSYFPVGTKLITGDVYEGENITKEFAHTALKKIEVQLNMTGAGALHSFTEEELVAIRAMVDESLRISGAVGPSIR